MSDSTSASMLATYLASFSRLSLEMPLLLRLEDVRSSFTYSQSQLQAYPSDIIR